MAVTVFIRRYQSSDGKIQHKLLYMKSKQDSPFVKRQTKYWKYRTTALLLDTLPTEITENMLIITSCNHFSKRTFSLKWFTCNRITGNREVSQYLFVFFVAKIEKIYSDTANIEKPYNFLVHKRLNDRISSKAKGLHCP